MLYEGQYKTSPGEPVQVVQVRKGPHACSLGEADQGAQALDQELALVVRYETFAGGIYERLQLLPTWAPLPDFVGPHGDL
jgi:hypothetical protein